MEVRNRFAPSSRVAKSFMYPCAPREIQFSISSPTLGQAAADPWQAHVVTDPETVKGCLVALLIPHPSRTAVLVADAERATGVNSPSLPTVWLNNSEPELYEILDSVEVIDPATAVVLRQVNISAGESTQNSLMLEFDASAAEPSIGLTWQRPGRTRRSLGSSRRPAETPSMPGSASVLRAGRSCDRRGHCRGGLAARRTWTLERMSEADRPAIGAPRQHLLWGPSVVVSARSADGDVYFKCSADLFRHEAVVTQALAERMPEGCRR